MHRHRFLLGAVVLCLAAGPDLAAQQPHGWNADYTLEYRAAPVAGDTVADGLYAFTYAWNFGILNSESGPLGPSRIIVQRAPGLGPLQPDIRPGVTFDAASSFPNLVFSRPMLSPKPPPPLNESSSLFFGGLVSQLAVPGPYELGFDVGRTLAGGREVAPGATELRTFELSFTVRDPLLTNMQAGLNFQPFTPGPPPVTASGVTCAASSSNPARILKVPAIDPQTGTNVIWDVTDAGATEPLPTGESYMIRCTVALTNNNASAPANYMPAAHASGIRNHARIATPGDFVQMPTNAQDGPSDPLGAVRFEVTGSGPMLAGLRTRFERRASLRPVNDLCRGSIRITVSGPDGSAPMQLVASGPDGTETVALPVGATELHGIEPGTYELGATAPAGFSVTPANATVAIACGQLSEVFFTMADAQPPAINSVTPSAGQLWPPNNKMVAVTMAVAVNDNLDPAPACQITGVTSNEAIAGPGEAWAYAPGSLTVNLRASRNGQGSGRTYGITVTCTDAAGNTTTGTASVLVPHDQRK